MSYYPIEWPQLVSASELRLGDFGYLVESAHVGVLVGTTDGKDVAVFLKSNEPSYGASFCSALTGTAHRLIDFKYEIDPSSGEELERMKSPIGSLIVQGDALWIAARPKVGHFDRSTLAMGYAPVELGTIDRPSESDIPFAYASWRIVKYDGKIKHVLHERPPRRAEG